VRILRLDGLTSRLSIHWRCGCGMWLNRKWERLGRRQNKWPARRY